MDWLNYHHLLYFWVVAREGSVTRASEQLHLSQPTISAQIRALEISLGQKLFSRSGRNLVLTDCGKLVYRYADSIFPLGRELLEAVKGKPASQSQRVVLGIADVLPKLIAYKLIEPALKTGKPVQVICREDHADRLLAELSLGNLDVVLSDTPASPIVKVRAYSHLLGECTVQVLAVAELARKYKKGFPGSMNGAPFLLPIDNCALRRTLDQYFDTNGIRPSVVGEFQDTALMKAFAQAGTGLMAAPAVLVEELRRQYGLHAIGEMKNVRERFYAITVDRKLKHPAVVAISEAARRELFA
jgi:LysR family transcriptional regulator, transcriptional activator of nhaA